MTRNEINREIEKQFGLVPRWMQQLPEGALQGFWGMARGFWLAETALPNVTKELVGLGISGATRCRYCTHFHTEVSMLFGATPQQIAETSAMSGLTSFASTFLNAQQVDYEQFCRETEDIVNYIKKNR